MTVVVALCAMVLLLLVYSTALSDAAAANRYARAVKQEYRLESRGQEWLATAPTAASATIGKAGGRHLEVAVDAAGNVTRWQLVPRQNTPNAGITDLLK